MSKDFSTDNLYPYSRPYQVGSSEAKRLGKMLVVAVETMESAANKTIDPEVFKILLSGYHKLKEVKK